MASGSLFRLFFNFGYKGSSANDKSLLEMDLAEMVLVETDLEPTETVSPCVFSFITWMPSMESIFWSCGGVVGDTVPVPLVLGLRVARGPGGLVGA